MLTYCLKCKKNTKSIASKMLEAKYGRLMLSSKCAICDSKKSRFMKEQQPRFTYYLCGPFTKNKERIQKFMRRRDTNYIYRNDLDKAYFQHDIAYGKDKDLERRAQSDKVLKDKPYQITSNPKYNGYRRGLASMVFNFFDKKSKDSGIKNEIKEKEQLANQLHQPIIRKFKKRKVYYSFKDNIWSFYLADMQLISKYNKGKRYLLCVINLFSKYAWVVPLKAKKRITIVNAFQSILKESNRKPNEIWVDQGSEFYNSFFKKWLEDNDIK